MMARLSLREVALIAAMVLAYAAALHIAAQVLTGIQTCRIEQLAQCPKEFPNG